MKRLLGVLIALVAVLIGVEVHHYYIYEPQQFARMERLVEEDRSEEVSVVIDARLIELMHHYEDGHQYNVEFESLEGWAWGMGYSQYKVASDQNRVFNSIEETLHQDKQLSEPWKRVHMAIDNKPSWQPTDQPFLTYTEDERGRK